MTPAQTTAPGLRERIAQIVDPGAFEREPGSARFVRWLGQDAALAKAAAILSITNPEKVRREALEEAARRVELNDAG